MVLYEVDLDQQYPVGALYFSVNDTDPSEFFGGEWQQIKDKFILACGDSYHNGETGGEANHKLTESEMPRHTHTQNAHTHTQNAHNHKQNAHHHQQYGNWSDGSGSSSGYMYSANRHTVKLNTDNTTATNQSATATNQNTTATNQYTGGSGTSQAASNGAAHNNMPPYLAVYVWVRVG